MDFELTTVTYGTASAPFLANRVLRQLAEDEQARFPLGAQTLRCHSYVDDILMRADTETNAREIQRQLIGILEIGGFPLAKWASNSPSLMATGHDQRFFKEAHQTGALGILWDPQKDTLSLRTIDNTAMTGKWTKRSILSHIARPYDSLGWLAPAVVTAKMIMQDLWRSGAQWDDQPPATLLDQWESYYAALPDLNAIQVPRWLGLLKWKRDSAEIHGFCNASQRAFAAVIYLRTKVTTEDTRSRLVAAKTKVAPLKPVSIPRLELCGAVLLARLLRTTVDGLELGDLPIHAWTDSSVTLAWIQGDAGRWKTFVANRVSEIQTLVPPVSWHVRSEANPADLASRGVQPDELSNSPLWWNGPPWESFSMDASQVASPVEQVTAEQRVIALIISQGQQEAELAARNSSFSHATRVWVFASRFLYNVRNRNRKSGPLTSRELQAAQELLLRDSQRSCFPEELRALRTERPLPRASPLRRLTPFIHEDQLMRVGGRLDHACLHFSERHPVILSGRSHVATLLARHAHLQTLHGGQRLIRGFLRSHYWITGVSYRARAIVRHCVMCERHRARPLTQQMASLPFERVTQARPFLRSGVDYAGPLSLRTTKGRGHKSYKGYIALFVCLSTKAIHLEAVSNLTTAAFIAAFHRFTRLCSHMFSDNGTTFKGAQRELESMFAAASDFYKETASLLLSKGTSWSFIPPTLRISGACGRRGSSRPSTTLSGSSEISP